MKALTEFLIAAVDLIEAEARSVRRGLFLVAVGLGLLVLAFLVVLAGLAMVLYAIFLQLVAMGISPAPAALLSGIIFLAIAGVGALVAARLVKR